MKNRIVGKVLVNKKEEDFELTASNPNTLFEIIKTMVDNEYGNENVTEFILTDIDNTIKITTSLDFSLFDELKTLDISLIDSSNVADKKIEHDPCQTIPNLKLSKGLFWA